MPPKTISQSSGMPQMTVAFAGWQSKINLVRITQEIINGFPEDIEEKIFFQGVIQPLSARQLMLKPEGERSWTWLQIHCFAGNLNLVPNDKIIYNNVRYKIMASKDYSLNNYIEYHATLDYQEVPA